MTKSIEKRVVEMQFDNQQFERGVHTTMGTLDKLKQSLNLSGAAKGLEEVDKAAKGINLSGLGSAIETVKSRFSALEVVAVTALANLTNSAVNAGKRVVESLTLEPVHQGFAEYELKMGAVQTIMASTGADIGTVNGYLDELNTYADRTIYSFSDMTQSIGKFTNAGVSLEDAVKAIQGISNEAAVSGANANEASRAMYNFAQALSSGAVKLIDWKSIENANMATVEFKQSLIDTALAMGTVVKEGDKYRSTTTDNKGKVSDLFTATSMFNDALSSQWMTTEVLVQTLGNYATDVREMSAEEKKAYEEKLRGIGYTEEQIEAIEKLGQKAFDSAQDVKTFSQLMDTLKEAAGSGWATTFEILFGDLEEAKVLWTAVSKVVGGFIDGASQARNEVLKGWDALGGRADLIDAVKNAFSGLSDIVRPIAEEFRNFFPAVTAERLYGLTKGLKEFTSHLKLSDQDAANLKSTFRGLFAAVDIVKLSIGALIELVAPMTKGFGSLSSGILSVTGAIGEWLVSIDIAIYENDLFGEAVRKVHDILIPALQSIREHIGGAVAAVKEFAGTHFKVPDLSGFFALSDKLGQRMKPFEKIMAVAGAVIKKLAEAFRAAAPVLARMGGIVVDALGKVCDGISKALHGEGFDSLIDLLNGGMMVGIGAGVMKFIKNLTGLESVAGDGLGGIKEILDGAKDALADLQATLKSETLKKIAVAIAILAGSLLVLSMIDSDRLGGALASVTILFGELGIAMSVLEKTVGKSKGLGKAGSAMIGMSAAVLVLASALKKVADIEPDKLKGSLLGITVLIGELGAFCIALSKWGGKIETSAAGVVLFSGAVYILGKAVAQLSGLDPEKMKQGLIGVGAVLGELALFMAGAKFGGFSATQGLAIIGLAAALLILEKAVSAFGSMKLEIMLQGLIGIGTALTLVGLAMNTMPKNMIAIGIGLGLVAGALWLVCGAVKDAGGMEWETIGKGMTVLAGAMTILAVALNFMKGTLGAAAAVLVVSAALAVFVPVLKALGSMELSEIGTALLVLAGAFTVLGIAGAVLGPMVPAILGLSASLALLGVAVVACGVGLLAFSAGLAALAVSGVAGVTALVAVLEILTVGILGVVAKSAKAFGEAVKALVLSAVDVIVECAPAIVEGALTLLEEVLKALGEHAPNIVAYLMDFLIGVFNAVAERLPELIRAAANLIGSFFRGVVDVLKGVDTTALLEGIAGIGLLSAIMVALSAVAALIPGAMVGVLGLGAVIAEVALVLAAVGAFAQLPGLEWLIGEGGDLLQKIGGAIGKFVGGIAGGFLEGVSASLPQIGLDLTGFMTNAQGFIDGAKRIDPAMLDGVNALAQTVLLLTAADILEGLTGWLTGGSGLVGFGEELAEFAPYFKRYSDEIAGIDPAVIGASSSAALALAEMASKLPNSGGLAGKIFGENNLSDFGKELAGFGPYIRQYAQDVAGIDPDVVASSANAAKALGELAENLPNSGGLVSWFAGDNDIGAFGQSLEEFGRSFSAYYNSVSGVDTSLLGKVIAEVWELKELAEGIAGVDTSGLAWFADGLEAMGNKGIDSFIRAFTDAKSKVEKCVTEMLNAVTASMQSQEKTLQASGDTAGQGLGAGMAAGIGAKKEGILSVATAVCTALVQVVKNGLSANTFRGIGESAVVALINGVNANKELLLKTASSLCIQLVQAVKNGLPAGTFRGIGEGAVAALAAGMSEKQAEALAAAAGICAAVMDSFRENLTGDELKAIGADVAQGLAEGIRSNAKAVADAAAEAAKTAVSKAKAELKVKSPSRVFFEIGENVDLGLVNGIRAYLGRVADAGAGLGAEAVESMRSAIGRISDAVYSEMDAEPTIRPVLDLTDIQNGARRIGSLFPGGIDVSASYGRALAAAGSGRADYTSGESGTGGIQKPAVNSYNFVQNNYSPKALSRKDIYRQTKNQFAAMRGAVSGI